jgi:uncharacterized Zn-binding protein involved in type VI secretion
VTTGVKDSAGNVLGSQYETSTGFTTESAPLWAQEAYIKASNNDTGDSFGALIGTDPLALDGDTLAVGASDEDSNQTTITNGTTSSSDNSNTRAGAVYVYKRTGTTWEQEAYVKASNNDEKDWFGATVALDGDTLAVGAYKEDSNQTTITNGTSASSDNSNTRAGAVYVYKRTGTTWEQEAYIKASNNDVRDEFGYYLALDGDTLAVGAYGEDSNQTTITNDNSTSSSNDSSSDSGAVYVYKRTGTTWAQEAYIKASNNDVGDEFGRVALDGDTLAVGAYREDSHSALIRNGTSTSSSNIYTDSGAVYVYKRTGTTWAQEAYIKASNNNALDHFGRRVALDGDTLAVGARFEDSNQTTITNDNSTASSDNSNGSSGAVYVYKRTGTTWAQEAYVKASNNAASDLFGYNVALDGDTLAVGAILEDSNQTTITNDNSTASSDNSNSASGAVYVYKRTGTTWAQVAYVKASNNDVDDNFGYEVALDGDTLAVGAYGEDSNQTTITNDNSTASSDNSNSASGAVYVYSFRSRD